MTIEVRPFEASAEATWEQFASGSVNGTLLHRRRFLNYHGNRFRDCSLLLYYEGRLVGLLPAAESRSDSREVVSHPGATYGGLVHQGKARGELMLQLLAAVVGHYRSQGYRRVLYKAVPHIYSHRPAQDDLYALFRLGAVRTRCELSSAIELGPVRTVTERRRRGLNKALKMVALTSEPEQLPQAWRVLEDNLRRKHDASPTHSLDEMRQLLILFPNEILIRCATLQGEVVAAVVLFNTPRVWHAQYIASSERGYEVCALDALFDAIIGEATTAGARYFDFGTSNEREGTVLNAGLYDFKCEFGGGGVAHEYYAI